MAAADVTGGTEPYSYQWDTDPVQTNYIVEDLPIGTYTVTIVDDNGCAGSAVVTIAEPLEDPEECFDPASLGVGIPNAFSPNNDGVNDVFTVMTFNGTEITGFSIYDRWGKQVFHTSNATVGWDGTYEGKELPIGAYVYVANALTFEGEEIRETGTVTLIR